MRFHFSCTRNPHTEREVYTMRTPRLRLLSALLAVALFFTLLPVSALAEGGGSTGVSHAAIRYLNTDNKDIQGLTYILYMDHTATVANYDNSTPDGVIVFRTPLQKIISIIQSRPLETLRSSHFPRPPMFPAYSSRPRYAALATALSAIATLLQRSPLQRVPN